MLHLLSDDPLKTALWFWIMAMAVLFLAAVALIVETVRDRREARYYEDYAYGAPGTAPHWDGEPQ